MVWSDSGLGPPPDPAANPVLTTAQEERCLQAFPRGCLEEDLEARLADQRWRAALECFPLLAEPGRVDQPSECQASYRPAFVLTRT